MARVDLLVLGGGTAGLVAAVGAANQGARVVLVERHRTGGDCLWTGCVPSKSLIEAANAAHTARHSRHLGVDVGSVTVDLAAVMAHVRGAVGALAHHDSPDRLRREGVEVVTGDARFVGPDVVDVEGRELRFARALIATGAWPAIPPIPGLEHAAPLTNEDCGELTRAPDPLSSWGVARRRRARTGVRAPRRLGHARRADRSAPARARSRRRARWWQGSCVPTVSPCASGPGPRRSR